MSQSETTPLNPAGREVDEEDPERSGYTADPERNSYDGGPYDGNTTKKTRDPLHILILYGLSCLVSLGAVITALAGYGIVRTSPFDKDNEKWLREGYEKWFWGMQSILVLNAINASWAGFNFHLARKGRHDDIWVLNMPYDFLMWALLIAFGVLNMIGILWDRRLCDGWTDEEMYKKCDIAMFELLVVELVAVNLGIFAAVLQFILLVGRCFAIPQLEAKYSYVLLKRRIANGEQIIRALIETRNALVEETEMLESRRSRLDQPLPAIPEADDGDTVVMGGSEEDLIDINQNRT